MHFAEDELYGLCKACGTAVTEMEMQSHEMTCKASKADRDRVCTWYHDLKYR